MAKSKMSLAQTASALSAYRFDTSSYLALATPKNRTHSAAKSSPSKSDAKGKSKK